MSGFERKIRRIGLTIKNSINVLDLIKAFSLLSIAFITITIRLQPIAYGAYINEFDPYSYYTATKYIVERVEAEGLERLLDFFNWHQELTWYPHGVDVGRSYHPVLPYTGSFTYFLLNRLGISVSVEEIALYLPIFTALVTVFITYLIGRMIGGEFVGLMSALLLSTSPAFIPRSTLGWYDTEAMGMPMFVASIYFFLKSMSKSSFKRRMTYSLLSGLFTFLMIESWGAGIYLLGIYPLIILVINFLGVSPKRYYLNSALTLLTAIALPSLFPKPGAGFIHHPISILCYFSIIFSFLSERFNLTYSKLYELSLRRLFLILIALLIVFTGIFQALPERISRRYLSVVNPFYKSEDPLVRSVQEHAGSSFASFFLDFNVLLPFIVYGIFLHAKDGLEARRIALLILSLSLIYFTSSFTRLAVMASPILVIIGSYGVYDLVKISLEKIRQRRKKFYRAEKMRYLTLSIVIFLAFWLPIAPSLGIRIANTPVTLASASMPYSMRIEDWIDALEWIKVNTPEDAVIAAWWDYGYWISFIGGRRTLADNATMNSTRIRLLAEMFLSNETRALEILDELDADYVLIFISPLKVSEKPPYFIFLGMGEESKFIQMARIKGMSDEEINRVLINQSAKGLSLLPAFWETFLGKLIPYTYVMTDPRVGDVYRKEYKYPTATANSTAALVLVYDSDVYSEPRLGVPNAEVLIYKINKEKFAK